MELFKAAGLELDDDELALFQKRTEGLAAGLRLAAIAMAGHPDRARFVEAFSGSAPVGARLVAKLYGRAILAVTVVAAARLIGRR